jgi:NADH-quinone oxidoreductase subunit E
MSETLIGFPRRPPSDVGPVTEFSGDVHAKAREIIARYPADRSRSALLPLLHLVQAEEGYVSPGGIGYCARTLGLTRAEVGAVATFYTMYKRRPAGDWLISVCTNTMCDVLGGRRIFEMLSEYLSVGHNETTADGSITIEHAECLAACDFGPVMTVNYEFFDQVDVEGALGIVTRLQAGDRPEPTRGARLCTLREISLQLAGFADPRSDAVADGQVGDATLRGVRLAEEAGVAAPDFDPATPIVKPKPKEKK